MTTKLAFSKDIIKLNNVEQTALQIAEKLRSDVIHVLKEEELLLE
jgi:hypothetical protein